MKLLPEVFLVKSLVAFEHALNDDVAVLMTMYAAMDLPFKFALVYPRLPAAE
jgi:hypothetical protein